MGQKTDKEDNGCLLFDRFGRRVTYLRVSVTDRCDLRCVYCMSENMTFLPRPEILTMDEIHRICACFVQLGVNKIRVTGGEPLVRRNISTLLNKLSPLTGLHELVLTTNGMQLAQYAEQLRAAGVRRLNISLDSLKPTRFKQMTRVGDLSKVLAGLAAAQVAGFERIKINTVILKGRNDDEVVALVKFACVHQLDISFIEEMPLGDINEHSRSEAYVSSDELMATIRKRWQLIETSEQTGGPSRYYRIPGYETRIGFISPHSHNFCAQCNRVRLTADGRLLLCLGDAHSVSLRDIIREHPEDDDPLRCAIIRAMQLKPEAHTFTVEHDRPQVLRFMNMTGG